MFIDYHAITHPGRVRQNNEDAYLVSALDGEEPLVNGMRPSSPIRQNGILAAVADGMGGAASGEIASREGLASVAVNLFGHWGRFPAATAVEADLLRALRHAAEAASAAVHRYADADRGSRGMGSTLTAAVVWNGHVYVAQVGDSRAYLFRAGELVPLTEDQTLVRELVNRGALTPEQARRHPQRSVITQALGGPEPIKVGLSKATLRRGDRLLLCTDGLYGELPDPRLAAILDLGLPARQALERMLEEALAQGGRDNITALLLELGDPAFPLPVAGERVKVTEPAAPAQAPLREGPALLSRLGRILGRNR
jgi:protein phosphatase